MSIYSCDKARADKFLRGLRIFRKRRGAFALLCAGIAGAALTFFTLIVFLFLSDDARLLSVTGQSNSVEPTTDTSIVQTHIAIVLDGTEPRNFSHSLLRSLSFYTGGDIVVHAVIPSASLPDIAALLQDRASVRHYDANLCKSLIAPIWHVARKATQASLCSLFLSQIVPAAHVLYIDVHATIVADVVPCISPSLHSSALFALAPDLGASCADRPDFCYPLAFEWTLPSGLVCGTTPARARAAGITVSDPNCRQPGESEPLALNANVVLMDLHKMRTTRFTDKLIQATLTTWRILSFRQAAHGVHDLLNNFLRLYPETLADLPCGCNYQFSGARRMARCAGRNVIIARGEGNRIGDVASRDRYVRHFNYFRQFPIHGTLSDANPPRVPLQSQVDNSWKMSEEGKESHLVSRRRKHVPTCPHQNYLCAESDRETSESFPLEILQDKVYILTRTSARPFFFKQMVESVTEQTHPHVSHLVGTDDMESRDGYLSGLKDVVMFDSKRHLFDPSEVCRKCRSPTGKCASAPSLSHTKERQIFFDCYCATGYPMNGYMNDLHARVSNGWIMYLDDDNLLVDKFAVSEFLATVQSRDALIAFRSHLGRVTPTDENFKRRVVMGDFDSSNFAFHSLNMRHAKWSSLRCGDFRLGAHLSSTLAIQWVDRTFIQANPMRSALGGLGSRADVSRASVSVVITSYQSTGWRPQWVRQIVSEYTKPGMEHLVHKVILVWNNLEAEVPTAIANDTNLHAMQNTGRFAIIHPSKNSLNNRWTATLKHIETDIVLNLDDDVYVRKTGLVCMLSWLCREPTRMIGPFVRRIERGGTYVLNELLDSSKYSMVLPRILLLPTVYLKAYAREEHAKYHEYVDTQSAHCDDIFLNIVALEESRKPPLRVLLPEESVVDFYSKCWTSSKTLTGGLGLQKGRTPKRNECVKELMRMRGLKQFKNIAHIATCLPRGNAVAKVEFLPADRYKQMKSYDFSCGRSEEGGGRDQ